MRGKFSCVPCGCCGSYVYRLLLRKKKTNTRHMVITVVAPAIKPCRFLWKNPTKDRQAPNPTITLPERLHCYLDGNPALLSWIPTRWVLGGAKHSTPASFKNLEQIQCKGTKDKRWSLSSLCRRFVEYLTKEISAE